MITTSTRLTCCGGIYAHRSTCQYHRHTFDGPRDCAACRALQAEPEWRRRAREHELPVHVEWRP